jgi:hypothetical protein
MVKAYLQKLPPSGKILAAIASTFGVTFYAMPCVIVCNKFTLPLPGLHTDETKPIAQDATKYLSAPDPISSTARGSRLRESHLINI